MNLSRVGDCSRMGGATHCGSATDRISVVATGAVNALGSGLNAPQGVAVDAAGNVYVADTGNNAVKQIVAATGAVITLGSGFNVPTGVAVDTNGRVYAIDPDNLWKFAP